MTNTTDIPHPESAAEQDSSPRGETVVGARDSASHSDSVAIDGNRILITSLAVEDPTVVAVLERHRPDHRPELVERMLAVGARGLTSMGIGLDLADVDGRVKASVVDAIDTGRRQVAEMIDNLTGAVSAELNPDQRTSAVSRLLAELDTFRSGLEDLVDPSRTDSHTSTLLRDMAAMLGPGGALEARLRTAFDPDSDGSALAATLRRLEQRMDELHTAVAHQNGRQAEAERGTAKGFDYEDELDERLREWARPRQATVERTSHTAGIRGGDLVGDFVVIMPNGTRIVIEAKTARSLSLNGRSGILTELHRATDNRGADVGICISRHDAFPAEVGPFGVYGDCVLAVDDPDGTLLTVALTWAAQNGHTRGEAETMVDTHLIQAKVERIRSLANLLSSNRRSLTDIVASVEKVRANLDSVRLDLLESAADINLAMRSAPEGEVLPIAAAG